MTPRAAAAPMTCSPMPIAAGRGAFRRSIHDAELPTNRGRYWAGLYQIFYKFAEKNKE